MSDNDHDWILRESAFDVRFNRHYEGLFAIGSGPLQQRASLEEGLSHDPQDREYLRIMGNVTVERFPPFKSRVGTFLPGVAGPHPTCGHEMINLPALHGLLIYVGNERLDMEHSRIEAYERRLDLRTGRLTRTVIWQSQRGARLEVRFERFISAFRRHVMALRCHIRHLSGPPAELRLVGTLDADVRTNGFDHFEEVSLTGEHEPVTVDLRTNGGDRVAGAALVTSEHGLPWTVETGPRWAVVSAALTLGPEKTLSISKFAALTSSRHVQGSPLDVARSLVWNAASTGFDRLTAESDAVWKLRWERSDVVIEGDPASQLALRTSLYHLLRAVVEHDSRVAIDPKAAGGEAYCGRYFWDTEMFILPMFLYTRPEVGRTLAAYRISSLEGARRNARRYGYSGARYAWESSPAGDEQCPNWQYADHEVHVTADVAYGLLHAHLVAQRDVLLLPRLVEVLTETARYWGERVHYSPQRDEYELLLVMGPDEYTPFSRNNAYTNHLVSQALGLVDQVWEALRQADADAAARLEQQLHLQSGELAHFRDIAGKLRLPYDADRRLVLQSDDFFSLEPFDFARYWRDRKQPAGGSVSQERLYRSQILKQADVVQLMMLCPHQFDREQMATAYDAYEPLTSHDSSLSRCVHAVVAAWLGREEEALRMWDAAVQLDLTPGAAAEGPHAACAGGAWQAAVFGFAGVRTRMQSTPVTQSAEHIDAAASAASQTGAAGDSPSLVGRGPGEGFAPAVLHIDPHLPQRWRALRFPFVWSGQRLYVHVEPDQIRIEHRGGEPIPARIYGREVTLSPGKNTTIASHQS